MKKPVLFVVICVAVLVGILLFANKTFIHDYYAVENEKGQQAKITTLPFSYFAGEPKKHNAVFFRLGNRETMQNRLNHYVEGLTSCYDDGAFCDTKQDITIYSYQVSDGFLLHKITLVYDTIDLKDQENANGIERQTIVLNGVDIKLLPGDIYTAAGWGDKTLSRLNGKSYDESAVTGRGISIGSTLEQVLDAYQIKDGYALWKVYKNNVPGKTLITYEKGGLSEEGLTRATLIFATYRMEGQWYALTVDETKQFLSYLSGGTKEKPYATILLYQFEFPYNGSSDRIRDKTLGGFSIRLESDE